MLNEARARQAAHPDGRTVTVHDTIFRAVRPTRAGAFRAERPTRPARPATRRPVTRAGPPR